jgi:cell volume regulation protein A
MDLAPVILILGALVFLAHFFALVYARTRVPDVLFLIAIGLVLGPLTGIVKPEDLGAVGPVFVSVTLIFILFEGGLGMDVKVLARALTGAAALGILCFAATLGIAFAFGVAFLALPPLSAAILGAVIGGTSSAVVLPLVERLAMHEQTRTILVLESALTDILCVVVTLALLEAHKLGAFSFLDLGGEMLAAFLVSCLIGGGAGVLWAVILHRVRTLRNAMFLTPAFAFILCAVVDMLHLNGYIAVLAMGVAVGNMELLRTPVLQRYLPDCPIRHTEGERLFFGEIVFLLKTFFFIFIGLSLHFRDLWGLVLGGILVLILFLMRGGAVRIVFRRSGPPEDAVLTAVILPKGLAAAVLASLPLHAGVLGGETIQEITFMVILLSILLTSVGVFAALRTPFGGWYRRLYE